MTVHNPIVAATAESRAIEAVIDAGREAAARGWVPATSGNFSVRVDAAWIAITRSGTDKGHLTSDHVLLQNIGQPLAPGSSAEAELHRRLYTDSPDIGAVFHTHADHATVVGLLHAADGEVVLTGWELQKALSGIRSHEAVVEVPVFANDQDVSALSERIASRLAAPSASGRVRAPGYVLAGHGLYAWGRSPAEAFRYLEALETLFRQHLILRRYQS